MLNFDLQGVLRFSPNMFCKQRRKNGKNLQKGQYRLGKTQKFYGTKQLFKKQGLQNFENEYAYTS